VDQNMRIAIPCHGDRLAMHFGHSERFALVNMENGQPGPVAFETPPAHEPGVLPRWLAGKGVSLVIAGGMGQRAQQLFAQSGIRTIFGAPGLPPDQLVRQYLDGTLAAGENVCDH